MERSMDPDKSLPQPKAPIPLNFASCGSNINITLAIRAHAGHKGNEAADSSAKQATFIGSSCNIQLQEASSKISLKILVFAAGKKKEQRLNRKKYPPNPTQSFPYASS
ncbi:hypothetical protein AVEN_41467-1 [Araneus ventricosus]|uniref:RNase H type-1 domain-containing protein n=1 Tax=Araneus ventricosus TaxID=182803 RepID=A0A4Y2F0N9_ARAVE|nr:hypothetical protein AVEN_41467-1 [Araneus ventricosus]